MMGDGFGMGFGGGFMWLIWLLLAVALAWVLKSIFASQENHPDKVKTAMEILEERYVPGEIGQEELNLETAVGRGVECVIFFVWQGTTTSNSLLLRGVVTPPGGK